MAPGPFVMCGENNEMTDDITGYMCDEATVVRPSHMSGELQCG